MCCLAALVICRPARAQDELILSSGYGARSQTTYLNLYLSQPLVTDIAAVQWTFTYTASSIAAVAVNPGPAAIAAQKTVTCVAAAGSYTCILSGVNNTAMQSGVIAVVGFTLAENVFANVPVGVTALAASVNAIATPLETSGGTIYLSGPYGTVSTNVTNGPLLLADPQGVALDSSGNLFIADTLNHRVIRVTSGGAAGVVAGIGSPGYSGDGGLATSAQFNQPVGVAVASDGTVYVADRNNHVIRKFLVGGTIATVAGNGTSGWSGDNGPAAAAQLAAPSGVALDSSGNLYIADTNNNRIRMVTAANHTIATIAGTGSGGFSGDGGPAAAANLFFPAGIAVDAGNNIYFSDSGNNRIRRFTAGGDIVTVAGGGVCCGLGDGGPATAANLSSPAGVAVDSSGNIYIGDSGNQRVRAVTAQNGIITPVAGNGVAGAAAGQLNGPAGVTTDSRGELYVADANNNRVERITLFPGSVTVGSASAAPGSIVPIPLTLNLTPGISIDSLGVTVSLSTGSGTLSFRPASGISPPNISSSSVPGSIALAWNGNLALGATPAVSGTVLLGTIGVPIPPNVPIGSLLSVTVAQVGGDLTLAGGILVGATLAAGPPGILLVQTCNYLVGDVYPVTDPASNHSCGEFGDNQITFEDVVSALQSWSGAPDWQVPNCTDLFDALDAFPPDNPNDNPPVLGGDGLLTLADVQVTLGRWANLDPSRPQRPGGSYLRFPGCAAALTAAISRGAAPRTVRPSRLSEYTAGTVAVGAAEADGGTVRVPVYLQAPRTLTAWALAMSTDGPAPASLRFTDAAMMPAVLHANVPSMVSVAWLRTLTATAGHWVLLGYVEWDREQNGDPSRLVIRKAEAATEDGMTRRLEIQNTAPQ